MDDAADGFGLAALNHKGGDDDDGHDDGDVVHHIHQRVPCDALQYLVRAGDGLEKYHAEQDEYHDELVGPGAGVEVEVEDHAEEDERQRVERHFLVIHDGELGEEEEQDAVPQEALVGPDGDDLPQANEGILIYDMVVPVPEAGEGLERP